jgi:hypothetical protein
VIIADGYVELLELGAPALAAALEGIVAPGGVPALVHCAIGKDRTGVLVALLLAAAGVEREAIVADYALSHQAVSHIREQLEQSDAFRALAKQVPAFVFDATPQTMELFLERLDERWGGAGYFVASVDPAAVERWRRLFVDLAEAQLQQAQARPPGRRGQAGRPPQTGRRRSGTQAPARSRRSARGGRYSMICSGVPQQVADKKPSGKPVPRLSTVGAGVGLVPLRGGSGPMISLRARFRGTWRCSARGLGGGGVGRAVDSHR